MGARSSLDELQQRSGGDFGGLADQAQSTGPQQGLEYLQGLSGDVREGRRRHGRAAQHATHYRASIDYAKVAAKLPDSVREARRERARRSSGTVPADVWINDDDQVVKMHLVIDAGSARRLGRYRPS